MKTIPAVAVIGANYGDEGKGATTHMEARKLTEKLGIAPTVVRFNGGSQAGHTVQLSDGRRHVFSQLGSGTFLGSPTFLSEYFLFDPVSFFKEYDLMKASFNITPKVYIDPDANIVTLADVYLNQWNESRRRQTNAGVHGSCGRGIGQTMTRINEGYTLTFGDLFHPSSLISKLRAIEDRAARYLDHHGASPVDLGILKLASTHWQPFLEAVDRLGSRLGEEIESVRFSDYIQRPEVTSLVFEGAQGLLLDQHDMQHFPHVTYSSTGISNVHKLMVYSRSDCASIELESVVYCTRPYLTRHGAGPIHATIDSRVENPDMTSKELRLDNFKDATNQPNPWQGHLRLAELDLEKLKQRISKDMEDNGPQAHVPIRVSVSCVDHSTRLFYSMKDFLEKSGFRVDSVYGLGLPFLIR